MPLYTYQKGQIQKSDKPFTGKMRDNRNSHLLLVGLQNGRGTLEAISYRGKYSHTT